MEAGAATFGQGRPDRARLWRRPRPTCAARSLGSGGSRAGREGDRGNIVPAIATTNAIIAGFIVLEALKVLGGRVILLQVRIAAAQPRRAPQGQAWLQATSVDEPANCPVCGDEEGDHAHRRLRDVHGGRRSSIASSRSTCRSTSRRSTTRRWPTTATSSAKAPTTSTTTTRRSSSAPDEAVWRAAGADRRGDDPRDRGRDAGPQRQDEGGARRARRRGGAARLHALRRAATRSRARGRARGGGRAAAGGDDGADAARAAGERRRQGACARRSTAATARPTTARRPRRRRRRSGRRSRASRWATARGERVRARLGGAAEVSEDLSRNF